MAGALDGIRVIELGQEIQGPLATLHLSDMGAEVIKVEPPGSGGPSRPGNQRNGSFFFLNRNKRSIVLDLASPEGHQVAMQLIRSADVLIENMAPGTMDRLGLGYAKLRVEFPRLVYCSIKGYLSGPYQARPLMDEPGQMAAGLALSLNERCLAHWCELLRHTVSSRSPLPSAPLDEVESALERA